MPAGVTDPPGQGTFHRQDAPRPLLRRGPRPLLLHLTLAMLRSSASVIASPNSSHAWHSSNKEVAAAIANSLGGRASASFPTAVLEEALRQDAALVHGIAAYRRHPWHRDLPDPPSVWQEGGSRLLDYGAPAGPTGGDDGALKDADGPTVLFVPSLVNRAYVLDLAPGHSMLRWLAKQGIRPLLLDWGWPGAMERRFTLTDYIAGRLERAMAAAAALAGGPTVLAGYCMGGTMAVAAAQRRPDLVRALTLLAAPWDFHAADPERAVQAGRSLPLFEPVLAFDSTLTVDVLQMLFTFLDPFSVGEKYRGFGRLDPEGERARLFVALEDWLNDGVPLAAPVARECLSGWYGDNTPASGDWLIAGLPVDPATLQIPAFVVVPGRDRIVPPDSARPLAQLITSASLHEPIAGHIGMVAGMSARRVLWQPLLAWLRSL